MLALAAARLGFDVAVLTPEPDSPAARVSAHEIVADYEDADALARLAELADVVTYEFENVPAGAVERLVGLGVEVAPGLKALAAAQDRVAEKTFLNDAGAATVAFAAIDAPDDIAPALARLGAPALLKTRREGYDGKGQAWITRPGEARDAWTRIGGRPAILEARADFRRELSVIAARGRDGRVAAYPPSENQHAGGILRRTLAPADVSPEVAAEAMRIAGLILAALDYVGVIGVELFQLSDRRLLVNEIAPRVHNTGHWTADACEVDQFEQHIRAAAGWPLGPTQPFARAEMLNLIGEEALDWRGLAADPAARLWLYGKRDVAPGRKMGHVTRLLGRWAQG